MRSQLTFASVGSFGFCFGVGSSGIVAHIEPMSLSGHDVSSFYGDMFATLSRVVATKLLQRLGDFPVNLSSVIY